MLTDLMIVSCYANHFTPIKRLDGNHQMIILSQTLLMLQQPMFTGLRKLVAAAVAVLLLVPVRALLGVAAA